MQQLFKTKNWSISDFKEWNEKGELDLVPKFQRRGVWPDKARSFLVDTIVRGKPVPKFYMRHDVNPKNQRVKREIVDGQQRLRTVFLYLQDGFPILKVHNEHPDYANKLFSELDNSAQKEFLNYEFAVDLLEDLPDSEIYEIFARLNTYSITLNAQELRNSQWFGGFKTTVYSLSNEFMSFWEVSQLFTDKQILRMAEAEFVSELVLAMMNGIQQKTKKAIDDAYKRYDDNFPKREAHEKNFRSTMDVIGEIFDGTLNQTNFSQPRLFYPLFCVIYHSKYGLPQFKKTQKKIISSDFPKVRSALEKIDEIIEKKSLENKISKRRAAGETERDILADYASAGDLATTRLSDFVGKLSKKDDAFYNAYIEHWVHARNRKILAEYINDLVLRS